MDPQLLRHLRSARRFVFDKAASGFLGKLDRAAGSLLLREHRFAKPPFPAMWVEFDNQEYLRGYDGPGVSLHPGTAQQIGHLIMPDEVAWTFGGGNNLISLFPVGYALHRPYPAEEEANAAESFGMDVDNFRRAIIGPSDANDPSLQDVMRHHTPLFLPWFSKFPIHERAQRLIMGASELGRLISALLLLTSAKAVVEFGEAPQAIGLLKNRKAIYLAHTTVHIRLGERKAIKMVKRALDVARRRRHEVHGHWCQSRKIGVGCQHDWTQIDQDGLRFACICGAKRWWKAAHERGDASLGYVTKDYEVTK